MQTIYQGAPETDYGHLTPILSLSLVTPHPFKHFFVNNFYDSFFDSFVPGHVYENEKTFGAFDSSGFKGLSRSPRQDS